MANANQPTPNSLSQDLTGSKIGRFLIRRLLGQGGMGQVYEAEDTRLKRPVALKRMAPQVRTDDSYRRRFLREAECASRLTHQHIAGIYDVIEQEGEMFLVMEFVGGETLRQRMQRPFPMEELLDVFTQCATALVAAQQQGIVHRDIKPENIMLTESQQAKILDFGVARAQPNPGESVLQSAITTSGGLSGTLAYMPPEALLERPVDGRSDIFALGVTLYEAATGQHPFMTDTSLNTMERILHHDPPQVGLVNPRAPLGLSRILSKMLSKTPADRYATSADLLVDLRALHRSVTSPNLTGSSQLESASSQSDSEKASGGKGTFGKALIAIAVVAVCSVSLYLFVSTRKSEPVATRSTETSSPAATLATLSAGQAGVPLGAPNSQPIVSAAVLPSAAIPKSPAPPSAAVFAKALGSGLVSSQPKGPARVREPESADTKDKPYVTPGLGDIEVITDVLAARAVLSADDGKTQQCDTPCRFEDLRPGRFSLQIAKDGYQVSRHIVDLQKGKLISENVTLEAQKASLDITSDPSQAEIYINGEKQSSLSPASLFLAPGTYRIALQKSGYGRYEGTVTLKDEDIRGLHLSLQAQSGTQAPVRVAVTASGVLDLRTVPPGADILVDGSGTGQKTPFRLQVPAGQHTVTFFLRGYKAAQKPIDIQENQTLPIQQVLTAQ